MKKILVACAIMAIFVACKKQNNDFPDFDYTTGYFPYQYPVRTLVLGDYIYDNSNDNNHKFLISAGMGGVYTNTKDRIFDIEVADDLCKNVLFQTGDTIHLMPSKYYTLNSDSKLTIPAGKINGGIEVQLTDAFFDDSLAYRLGYVIPIRIIKATNLDSILRGQSTKTSPDPRNSALWDVLPKDFTMFAVNFINAYHGTYLHRGVSVVKDNTTGELETKVYRTPYIVNNELWNLVTTGKKKVTINAMTHSVLLPGTFNMDLNFSDDGTCAISESKGSTVAITGSGKFLKDADEWGDKKRDAIFINYKMTSGNFSFSATDTLVVRDRAIKMQLYSPTVF